jgi:hypothetical protein
MHTMHPTLLIGPADWAPERLPRDAFERRLAQLWVDNPGTGGVIVYGTPQDRAALCYLTHFTPKLEPAFGLIPKDGEPRLLVGGGASMIDAARPLTFVTDLRPLRDIGAALSEWMHTLRPGAGVVLLNAGEMTSALRGAVDGALRERPVVEGDEQLAARMRVKSSRERDLVREACGMLSQGVEALRSAFARGCGVTDCVLEAEHVLLEQGAQDVRNLFSVDRGRTLRPFEATIAKRVDPMPVYLAVRHEGYWVDAVCSLCSQPDDLAEQAHRVMMGVLAEIRPGVTFDALDDRAEALRGPIAVHPMTAGRLVRSIGLSLHDNASASLSRQPLAPAETYSVQVGLLDAGRGAFASALIAITDTGFERLWSTR